MDLVKEKLQQSAIEAIMAEEDANFIKAINAAMGSCTTEEVITESDDFVITGNSPHSYRFLDI